MSETNSTQKSLLPVVIFGTAVIGLIGLLVALAVRFMPILMPRMMAKMMPKMMGYMHEAGVEPPCAQILKQYFEEERLKVQAA